MGNTLTASRILALHEMIKTALAAGAVSPQRALVWARRAAAGEDISVIEHLTPTEWRREENRPVLAHSNQQVLRTLTAVLSGGTDPGDAVDPEYQSAWPPGTFDDGRPGHGAVVNPPLIYEGGQLAENGARRALPYASGPVRGRYPGDPHGYEDDLADDSRDLVFASGTGAQALAEWRKTAADEAELAADDTSAEIYEQIFGPLPAAS